MQRARTRGGVHCRLRRFENGDNQLVFELAGQRPTAVVAAQECNQPLHGRRVVGVEKRHYIGENAPQRRAELALQLQNVVTMHD